MFAPTAHINLQACLHNLTIIKKLAPNSKILAMIKRDGYGHGALAIAKTLVPYVAGLATSSLAEAIMLREAGITQPILLLMGFLNLAELTIIDRYSFELVLHNHEQLACLRRASLTKPLKIWLKINSGMHRLGFPPAEVFAVYQQLSQQPMIAKPLRFMTHFADAGEQDNHKTAQQLARFYSAIAGLSGELSIANSAGILGWPETRVDWVRPGIMLYGASPYTDKNGLSLGLQPVMTLSAKLIATQIVAKGETIGYGSTYRALYPMRLGVVAIGYGDGYPRNAANGTPVLIQGRRVPLVGRVAMDMLTIDLTTIPAVEIGMNVILWGTGLPIEEIARYSGELHYELFCRLTTRVQYQYHHTTPGDQLPNNG